MESHPYEEYKYSRADEGGKVVTEERENRALQIYEWCQDCAHRYWLFTAANAKGARKLRVPSQSDPNSKQEEGGRYSEAGADKCYAFTWMVKCTQSQE